MKKNITPFFFYILSIIIALPINFSMYQIVNISLLEFWSLVTIFLAGGVFVAICVNSYFLDLTISDWFKLLTINKFFVSLSTVFVGTALFFMFNFLFTQNSLSYTSFKIVGIESITGMETVFLLEDNQYSDKKKFRTLNTLEHNIERIVVITQKSIFGYEILVNTAKDESVIKENQLENLLHDLKNSNPEIEQ